MRHITDRKLARSTGFTVLELMVATSIFAVVLLVLTAGVLSFSRDYFASVTRSNTQAVARAILDDVAHSIQFAQTAPTSFATTGGTAATCIDNVMYSYAVGVQVSAASGPNHQNKYGMVKRIPAVSCSAPADITDPTYVFNKDQEQELLGKNMRISVFSIDPLGNDTFTIHVRVAYGEDDLFGIPSTFGSVATDDWGTLACKSGSGSQFCAVSDLSTTVQRRIK